MGVFIETGSFRKAVSFAAGALPKRDGAPELSGMWLRAGGDRLVLSAFDGLQSAEAGVEAQSTDAEASLLVNGAALVSSVRALPTGEPKTKLTFTEGGLTMRCGKALFGLRGMRTEDYPVPPEPPVDGAVEIDAKVYFVKSVFRVRGGDVFLDSLTGRRTPSWRSTAGSSATEPWTCTSNTNAAPPT